MAAQKTTWNLTLFLIFLYGCGEDSKSDLQYSDTPPYHVKQARKPEPVRGNRFKGDRHLLLISIDGLGYQALRFALKQAPTLNKLARQGFFVPMQTVYPSVTWPSHMSMITGQYPRRHGILGNRWRKNGKVVYPHLHYRGVKSYNRVPTLFDLIKKKKIYTASLNWPYSQRFAGITYNFPEMKYSRDRLYSQTSKPLQRLLKKKFDQNIPWLPEGQSFDSEGYLKTFLGLIARSEEVDHDMFLKEMAIDLVKHPPRGKRPRASLVHFLTVDRWLHRYGLTPWALKWAVIQVDAMVAEILRAYRQAGILKKTIVIIVSDHGFLNTTHSIDLKRIVKSRPDKLKSKLVYNGHTAYVYLHEDEDKKDLEILARKFKAKEYEQCIEAIYTPGHYADLGLPDPVLNDNVESNENMADMIVLSRPHCRFKAHKRRRAGIIENTNHKNEAWFRGTHGYLPTHKNLHSFMLATGPGIKKLRRPMKEPVQVVDLAPTIAYLLNLRWPEEWPGFKDGFTVDGEVLKILVR